MARCLHRLTSALATLDPPLRVAQTRLKKRSKRPEVENCADEAYLYLVDEVKVISSSIKKLENKLNEAKSAHNNVSKQVERMEKNLKIKKNSLLIDQQKCMSMRRTFPFIVVSTRYV